jgi:DNA-binding beta-propeller fold protein YncE
MFVIYWAFLAGIIYSWAGEKMPWLTVHITLPLVFLSAHLLQTALGNFDWAGVWRRGGAIFGVALLLLIPALVTLNSSQPFQSQSLQSIRETLQFMMAAVVLVILAVVLWRYGRRLGGGVAARLALLSVLLMLSLLTIRFSWMLSFINYDYASEFLVYAHGGPDVKPALVQIDDISRRTVGDKMIKVAYDSGSTWPLEWYMREYPNRAFYGENPTRDALDAPVVIVDASNENKVKPYLGDKYTRFRYRLIWWPPEDYKNQSLTKIWENYVWPPAADDPALNTPEGEAARWELARRNREKLWRVFFYREHEYQLNEWPYVHRFYMYVRNDVLNEVWDYQGGPVQLTQSPAVDPYANKRFEANALNVWGSNGSDDGRFVTPRSLAVGPDGLVYVLDTGNNRVQVFDRDGKFLLKWGSQGFGDGQFNEPWGIAVGPEGAVYVADTWNHRLQAFSPNGQFLWKLGSEANVRDNYEAEPGKFWGPRGIAVDPQGNLYVTDTGNKRVQKFSPDGQFIQLWGGGGIVPGFFEEPVGIDVDSAGNIYVADTWNYRIQKFDPNFAPVAQWPVAGGWQGESVVNKPFLAVDAQGRVFITDPEGYRIIAYSNTGELLGTWGQYGQDLASFTLPVGLDFDPAEGTLFVADADSNRVMAFKPPF